MRLTKPQRQQVRETLGLLETTSTDVEAGGSIKDTTLLAIVEGEEFESERSSATDSSIDTPFMSKPTTYTRSSLPTDPEERILAIWKSPGCCIDLPELSEDDLRFKEIQLIIRVAARALLYRRLTENPFTSKTPQGTSASDINSLFGAYSSISEAMNDCDTTDAHEVTANEESCQRKAILTFGSVSIIPFLWMVTTEITNAPIPRFNVSESLAASAAAVVGCMGIFCTRRLGENLPEVVQETEGYYAPRTGGTPAAASSR